MLKPFLLCAVLLISVSHADTPPPPYQRVDSLRIAKDSWQQVHFVDGNRVYIGSGSELSAIDLDAMSILWTALMPDEPSIEGIFYREGKVYVSTYSPRGSKRPSLHVIDALTGAALWNIERAPGSSEIRIKGHRLFFVRRTGLLSCLDLRTKKVLWDATLPRGEYGTEDGRLCLTDSSVIVNYDARTTCLDISDGKVRWQQPESYLQGGSLIATAGVVWVPESGGSVGREEKSGRQLWKSECSPYNFAEVVDGRFVGLHDSLASLNPQTGETLWKIDLPYEGRFGKQRASLVGGHIFVDSADGVSLEYDQQGQLIWSSVAADAAIPLPCWSDEHHIVGLDRTYLKRYRTGTNPDLPEPSETRKSLARSMIASFDELDAAERKQLENLGQDAFDPLLIAFVAAASDDGTDASVRADGLYSVLEKVAKTENSAALRRAISQAPPASSDIRRLLKILISVGVPCENVEFFIAEHDRFRNIRESISYLGFALDYIARSTEPPAVAFMLSQLEDPQSHLRRAAYYNLAKTGGEPGIQAVRTERAKVTRTLSTLSQRVLTSAAGTSGEVEVLDQKRDSQGRTWGLLRSGALGDSGDLWLVEKVDEQWANPVYTNLSTGAAVRGQFPSASESVLALLGGGWYDSLVGNVDLLRDTDNDGLSDVVEARLGTNPDLSDTDGDGDRDDVDPWPNAPLRQDLTDAELVLSATYEACFHFNVRRGAAVLSAPPGVRPFEMAGRGAMTVMWAERDRSRPEAGPLESRFPKGVGLLSFASPKGQESSSGAERFVEWNNDHT